MNHKPSVSQSVRDNLINRYLEVLKKSLLNELYIENEARIIQVIS